MDRVQLFQGYHEGLHEAAGPLQRDRLLSTTKPPEIPSAHLIDLERMKGGVDLETTQQF